MRLRLRAHDDRARATSMPQLKAKKNRITKNNKYDKYKKSARHKQERHCYATYNFGHQTIESISNHDITKVREERERRQKRELIELSNKGFS